MLFVTRWGSVYLVTIDERCRTSLKDRGQGACPRLTLIPPPGQRTEANRSARPRTTVTVILPKAPRSAGLAAREDTSHPATSSQSSLRRCEQTRHGFVRPSRSPVRTTGHGTRSRSPWESPGKQPGSGSPTRRTPDRPEGPLNGYVPIDKVPAWRHPPFISPAETTSSSGVATLWA